MTKFTFCQFSNINRKQYFNFITMTVSAVKDTDNKIKIQITKEECTFSMTGK